MRLMRMRMWMWIVLFPVAVLASVLMIAIATAEPGNSSAKPVDLRLTPTPVRPSPLPACGRWRWCNPPPPPPPPGIVGPVVGGSGMESPLALLERLQQAAIAANRGEELEVLFESPEMAVGTQLVAVRINPLTQLAEIAGSTEAEAVLSANVLNLDMVADNAPSGVYFVAPCGEGCIDLDPEMQLKWLLAQAEVGDIPLASFVIAPIVDSVEVILQEDVGGSAAPYLNVQWNNASPAAGDDIGLVWSKDGEPMAVLTSANPLQRALGYLEVDGVGTRLYNTSIIDIAPLAPAYVPGLAEDLPPGEYQVDLYINGVIEGIQTLEVGAP